MSMMSNIKKATLLTIYEYMEPHRKEHRGLICSLISEEFFTSANAFGIRHNTKSQIRLQAKKKIKVYDRMFMMAVYVLQTPKVNEYMNELVEIRKNHN